MTNIYALILRKKCARCGFQIKVILADDGMAVDRLGETFSSLCTE